MIQVFFGVPESYRNSLGEVVGLNGPYGKGEKGLKGWPRPPPWQVRIGRGAGPPFLLSLSLFLILLLQLGKGGNLLLLGVGLPPLGAP